MMIIGRRAQLLSGLTWRATQVQDPHIKNVVAKYHCGEKLNDGGEQNISDLLSL